MITLTALDIPSSPASTALTTTPIVFVVDDDVLVRESLERLILTSGWQPETFASAYEFLAHPRTAVPSCLVLDVTLPDLGGLELQKRVAADRPDVPIIFLAGHADVLTSVTAMKAGALEFLTKPCSREVLVGAIRHALDQSRRTLERDSITKTLREKYA